MSAGQSRAHFVLCNLFYRFTVAVLSSFAKTPLIPNERTWTQGDRAHNFLLYPLVCLLASQAHSEVQDGGPGFKTR